MTELGRDSLSAGVSTSPVAPATCTFQIVHGYRPLDLDLYVPAGVASPPVVVWIHGGSFHSGDRRGMPPTLAPGAVFDALLSAGLAVASIDYRLSGEAHFPAQLEDVHAAISYLISHADALGVRGARLGVWGESAGGCLAALAALTSPEVAAAVTWYAITDLTTLHPSDPQSPGSQLLGGPADSRPALARSASPLYRVHAGAPPFLVIHGTADEEVPFAHSQDLHDALRALGVDSSMTGVDGAGHIFTGREGEIPQLLRSSAEYLRRHLA
ncbi:MAG: Esterase/lipase-like protein [Frankiales bacterium]|nr:Esterase/lipase-like protein [Frankiales bacterium]